MGTEGSGNPLHYAAFFHNGSLGIQVIHILGPVLNGGIAKSCIFAYKKLYAACMKVCHIVFRCGTALDEMKICSLIYNDQGMLKLSGSRCIQTEIGLQGNFHRNARRHINKGSA